MPTTVKKKPGRAAGGLARAASLTPARKTEIARRAALAKQEAASALRATHGSDERPLVIGDIEIPCYVLEGEIRVLSQRGLLAGLGLPRGSTPSGEDQLTVLANALLAQGLISADVALSLKRPIVFRPKHGGRPAHGYPATVLADVCEAILAARSAGKLHGDRMQAIARQCEILIRGFARVGIIALVDEATGFQADRARQALAQILEAFVAAELQPYVQTFPIEYYKELFRLRGLAFSPDSVKRPQYFGVLTNDIVYKRLAPGVLDELKRLTPRNEEGRPKAKYFQRLTSNVGYPKLQQHLGKVIATMTFSSDYEEFKARLDRIAPRMDVVGGPEQTDSGTGL